jgi:hypothetical protein
LQAKNLPPSGSQGLIDRVTTVYGFTHFLSPRIFYLMFIGVRVGQRVSVGIRVRVGK